MDSKRCTCIYCNALRDNSNYTYCKEEHSCCHDCDSCPERLFAWNTLRKFIKKHHSGFYVVQLEKKIENYVKSLINNCPLPDSYLDEDRAFGCHIKNYIDEFTRDSLHYNILPTSLILDNNLADDTVRAIIKHYSFRNTYGDGFDLSIECIKRGKMDYLAHYYKNIEPNLHQNALENRMASIIEFLTNNIESNTTDNVTKLREIYGKEIFDEAMIRMLSNVLYHERDFIALDNLPASLQSLTTRKSSFNKNRSLTTRKSSFNQIRSLDTLTQSLTRIKMKTNFDKNDLDRVRFTCPKFKIFKEYYNNYIQDCNILHSLLMDNMHIHDIYDENARIFAGIKAAIIS